MYLLALYLYIKLDAVWIDLDTVDIDLDTSLHSAEGSVGSATQLLEGRKPTFVTCLLERACSLSSIFHPDYLIRERHPVPQERRLSLQSDSLDCSFYVVDLYYRSLVKLRQESQIPPPL